MGEIMIISSCVLTHIAYNITYEKCKPYIIIYKLLFGSKYGIMKDRICPYCNKEFRTGRGLYGHIMRSRRCYNQYIHDIWDVKRIYEELVKNNIDVNNEDEIRKYLIEKGYIND